MINWILESDIFEENLEKLQSEILKQEMTFDIVKYIPFSNEKYNYSKNDFFYGSLEFAMKLKKADCSMFLTPELYNCHYYYPVFGNFLLNNKYVMLPFGDFLRQKDFIFDIFGSSEYNCIFCRPDSGFKTFTGMVMCNGVFDKDIEFIERYGRIPRETLVLISTTKDIKSEYRFVISDNEVVAGSLYKNGTNVIHKELNCEDDSWQYADDIIKEVSFNADPMWTLDVAQLNDDSFKVLEIGCFSCAGLYACNLEAIVRKVKEKLFTKLFLGLK